MSVLRIYDPSECDASGELLDWESCRTCEGAGEVRSTTTPTIDSRDPASETREDPCGDCEGFGSLRAAVLAELRKPIGDDFAIPFGAADMQHRCESCSHPMSGSPTWIGNIRQSPQMPRIGRLGGGRLDFEGRASDEDWKMAHTQAATAWLVRGSEPDATVAVHCSACDSLCDHHGPYRFEWNGTWEHCHDGRRAGDVAADLARDVPPRAVEASWRPVEVRRGMIGRRTLGDRFDPKDVLHVRPWDLRRDNVSVMCLRCWVGSS